MILDRDVNVPDELDADGDLAVTIFISEGGYDIVRWLDRKEAKRLVDHINKLFNFEQEHNEQ